MQTGCILFWGIFIVLVPVFKPTPHRNHGKNWQDLRHLVESNENFGEYAAKSIFLRTIHSFVVVNQYDIESEEGLFNNRTDSSALNIYTIHL